MAKSLLRICLLGLQDSDAVLELHPGRNQNLCPLHHVREMLVFIGTSLVTTGRQIAVRRTLVGDVQPARDGRALSTLGLKSVFASR